MKKLIQQMTLAALAAPLATWIALPVHAQSLPALSADHKTLADVSITYSALHMNSPVGGCGCFWLNGGSAEAAFPLWHYVSAVAELSGEHTGHVAGSQAIGLNLISVMGGVRVGRDTHRLYHPFVQGLLGGVHAFDSNFPSTTSESSASSFALALGGGLDIPLRKHFLIRPIQVDYQYMQLPNNDANQQHDLRLSAGVVFRFYR